MALAAHHTTASIRSNNINVTIPSIDFDECLNDASDCADNADCTNIDGSYTCRCQDGYIGDGISCARE